MWRSTVEPALKDRPIGHKNMVSQDMVIFGDRFSCIEMWDLLPGVCSPLKQVVFHGSGLS